MIWYNDWKLAALISILSTFASWWADLAAGHLYSSNWLAVWDGVVRLMFFCLVMFAGWTLRQQGNAIRARLELLERSQRLEEEIIGISEREQQRIGRDLHDGVCQFLVAIGFTASMMKQELEKEAHKLACTAAEISNLLHDAAVMTRDLARGLSPVDRDEGGLESALEELASSTSRIAGIPCSFICPGPVPISENTQAVHLFRIAQEALGNALKHGHAKSVIIALEHSDNACFLRVSDDGAGFYSSGGERKGMGLSIMRYRARMISGTTEIQPNSPSGTVVVCTIEKGTQTIGRNFPTTSHSRSVI